MIRGNIIEAADRAADKPLPQYQMRVSQVSELVSYYQNKPVELAMAAFNIGYSEGTKAEKARVKANVR